MWRGVHTYFFLFASKRHKKLYLHTWNKLARSCDRYSSSSLGLKLFGTEWLPWLPWLLTGNSGDFRIWTRFLRKYVYFRIINADVNPYCTLAQCMMRDEQLTTGSSTLQCCPQVSDHPSFSSQRSTCFPVIPSIVVLTTVLEFSISSVSVSCKFS